MNNFSKQRAQAQNKQFGTILQSTNIENVDSSNYREIINKHDFEYYMNEAYVQHAENHNRGIGYSVRWNPRTGKHEMFVAGSQGWKDWTLNVVDGILHGGEKIFGSTMDEVFEDTFNIPASMRPHLEGADFYRAERSKKLKHIADVEHIDVIYGHSRGGAVVADLDVQSEKIGVDAAMAIARNTDMANYHRPGVFDNLLGLSGKRNIEVDSGHGIHWAYGDYNN